MALNKVLHGIMLSTFSLALLSHNVWGEMTRSTFTTGIENHEPIDSITQTKDDQVIYYFTEIRGLIGHTVLHIWDFNGKQYSVIPFEIKGERWRVYSSKTLPKAMSGHWLVTVFDQTSGKILAQDSLFMTPSQTTTTTKPRLSSPLVANPENPSTPQTQLGLVVQPSVNETAKLFEQNNKETNTQQNKKPQTTPKRLPIWEILPR